MFEPPKYNNCKFCYNGKPNLQWLETIRASNLTIQLLLLSSITSIIYGLFDYWTSAYLFWWRVSTVTFILSAITFYFDVKRKLRRGETKCLPFRNTLYCKYMTILFVECDIAMLMLYMTIWTHYNYLYFLSNGTIIWTIISCLGIILQCVFMREIYKLARDEWLDYYKNNC